MADEIITLEALEAEAAAELEAEEAPASVETEDEAKSEEGSEVDADDEESASADKAAHSGKERKTVTLPAKRLHTLRSERKEKAEEAERLRRQNEELLAKLALLSNPQPAEPTLPTLESCDFDDSKYAAKMVEWQQHQVKKQLADLQRSQLEQQQAQLMQQKAEQEIAQHYERAAALGVPGYEDAERVMREEFGDSAIDAVINAIGEGSERVLFHLGDKRNVEKRKELADLLRHDPSGLRAMTRLGQILATLSTEPPANKISHAPAADKPVSGGQSGGGESAILKKLERLSRNPDRTAYREYRKTLTKAGQKSLLDQYDSKW